MAWSGYEPTKDDWWGWSVPYTHILLSTHCSRIVYPRPSQTTITPTSEKLWGVASPWIPPCFLCHCTSIYHLLVIALISLSLDFQHTCIISLFTSQFKNTSSIIFTLIARSPMALAASTFPRKSSRNTASSGFIPRVSSIIL